jgi:hypothetical protein
MPEVYTRYSKGVKTIKRSYQQKAIENFLMKESSQKRVENNTIQAIEQAFNPQLVVDKIEIKIKIDFLNL